VTTDISQKRKKRQEEICKGGGKARKEKEKGLQDRKSPKKKLPERE